jgi:hypothetical protein
MRVGGQAQRGRSPSRVGAFAGQEYLRRLGLLDVVPDICYDIVLFGFVLSAGQRDCKRHDREEFGETPCPRVRRELGC